MTYLSYLINFKELHYYILQIMKQTYIEINHILSIIFLHTTSNVTKFNLLEASFIVILLIIIVRGLLVYLASFIIEISEETRQKSKILKFKDPICSKDLDTIRLDILKQTFISGDPYQTTSSPPSPRKRTSEGVDTADTDTLSDPKFLELAKQDVRAHIDSIKLIRFQTIQFFLYLIPILTILYLYNFQVISLSYLLPIWFFINILIYRNYNYNISIQRTNNITYPEITNIEKNILVNYWSINEILPKHYKLNTYERVTWLNDLVKQYWPQGGVLLGRFLFNLLNNLLSTVRPPFLTILRFKKLSLGDAAPCFASFKTNSATVNKISVDLEFHWVSDCDVILEVAFFCLPSIQVRLKNLTVQTGFRFELRELHDKAIPGFDHLGLGFLKPPFVDFNLYIGYENFNFDITCFGFGLINFAQILSKLLGIILFDVLGGLKGLPIPIIVPDKAIEKDILNMIPTIKELMEDTFLKEKVGSFFQFIMTERLKQRDVDPLLIIEFFKDIMSYLNDRGKDTTAATTTEIGNSTQVQQQVQPQVQQPIFKKETSKGKQKNNTGNTDNIDININRSQQIKRLIRKDISVSGQSFMTDFDDSILTSNDTNSQILMSEIFWKQLLCLWILLLLNILNPITVFPFFLLWLNIYAFYYRLILFYARRAAITIACDTMLIKVISPELIPEWLGPEPTRKCDWLNLAISQFWPGLITILDRELTAASNLLITKLDIPSLTMIYLQKLHFGYQPLKLIGWKTFPSINNTCVDNIALELEIDLHSNTEIKLKIKPGVGTIVGTIDKLNLNLKIRIELFELNTRSWPGFNILSFTILTSPKIEFNVTTNQTIMKTINQKSFSIDRVLQFMLSNTCLYPRSVNMSFDNGMLVVGHTPVPCGILSVKILAGYDLQASDFSIVSSNATSDPYVTLSSSIQEFTTPTIMKNLNPIWTTNNSFECTVFDKDLHQIQLRVYDYDQLSVDDFIGDQSLTIQDLQDNISIDKRFRLENVPKGELKIRMLYTPKQPVGLLSLRLVSGHNLPICDLTSSDPYAIIQYENQTLISRTVYRNINPVWNQLFDDIYIYDILQKTVTFTLFDKDKHKDDYMCKCTLLTASLEDFIERELVLVMEDAPDSSITVRALYTPIIDGINNAKGIVHKPVAYWNNLYYEKLLSLSYEESDVVNAEYYARLSDQEVKDMESATDVEDTTSAQGKPTLVINTSLSPSKPSNSRDAGSIKYRSISMVQLNHTSLSVEELPSLGSGCNRNGTVDQSVASSASRFSTISNIFSHTRRYFRPSAEKTKEELTGEDEPLYGTLKITNFVVHQVIKDKKEIKVFVRIAVAGNKISSETIFVEKGLDGHQQDPAISFEKDFSFPVFLSMKDDATVKIKIYEKPKIFPKKLVGEVRLELIPSDGTSAQTTKYSPGSPAVHSAGIKAVSSDSMDSPFSESPGRPMTINNVVRSNTPLSGSSGYAGIIESTSTHQIRKCVLLRQSSPSTTSVSFDYTWTFADDSGINTDVVQLVIPSKDSQL